MASAEYPNYNNNNFGYPTVFDLARRLSFLQMPHDDHDVIPLPSHTDSVIEVELSIISCHKIMLIIIDLLSRPKGRFFGISDKCGEIFVPIWGHSSVT